MKRICVFCGSNFGSRPDYREAAIALADTLADRGLALVYGGASVGLMGVIADAMLGRGAEVVGVIPRPMVSRELAHKGLTQLRLVSSMHERKAVMADLSDGFIAMPGGFGTLEEFFETVTWGQLGIHAKPFGLLNVRNYFDGLLEFLDHCVGERFLQPRHRGSILVADEPGPLLDLFARHQPAGGNKWFDRRRES
jgi:uncharacterized protein (TIGR00730 family)